MNSENHPEIPADWYRQGFGALYPVLYAHRTVEAAEPEAAFAAQCLELRVGDRVLDVGCGNGRHMLHLIRRTPHVAGLDFSPDLLGMARASLGPGARLIRGDMRHIPTRPGFDAVTNFFTSFGYFQTADEDAGVLREIARVLRRGGGFFIDYLNPSYVRNTLVPQSNREYKDYAICERRWIDPARRRINKIVEVSLAGKAVGQWTESVRLYEESDLRDLIAQAGLRVAAVYGDYDGAALDARKARMILTGHKG